MIQGNLANIALRNLASPNVPTKSIQLNVTTAMVTTRLPTLTVRHTSSKYVQSMKLSEYPYLSKMDERKLTFLQINICGLSEHSRIALNHYVHEKNPDVVFLDETKANLLRLFCAITTLSVNSNMAWVEWQYY